MSIYLIHKNSYESINDQQTKGKQYEYTNNSLVKEYQQAVQGKYIEMTYEQRYLISLMINETQIKTTKPLFEHSIARFRRLQCTVLMRV